MPRLLAVVLVLLLTAGSADARCRCAHPRPPPCTVPQAKHRLTVDIDFAVSNGLVEVLSQTGLYGLPAADLEGKQILFVVLPRGEVFQGFLEDVIPGSVTAGAMTGTHTSITTGPVFAPGEYELLLFIDVMSGGGLGPQRGDLAAFDNTVCEPTGVSVRVAVGCEDATTHLTNGHFIVF